MGERTGGADGVARLGDGLFRVDYDAYLSRHDVVYETPAATPTDGMPLGNGDAGALFWMPPGGPRWELGKCDLWDDGPERPFGSWNKEDEEVATALRSAGTLTITTGLPVFDWMYLREFTARLELFPARATLRAATPFSTVEIETWVSRTPACLIVRYQDELEDPSPRHVGLERWGSRVFAHWYRTIVRDAERGLAGTASGSDGRHVWIVQKTRSHTFAVAATVAGIGVAAHAEHRRCATFTTESVRSAEFQVYLSIVSSEEADDPLAQAMANVDSAQELGLDRLRTDHRTWWSGFWEQSFVQVPDEYLENLWYLNHYLMGSGSQGAYPPHFINGIWNPNRDARAWNHYYHWNQEELNWPVCAAGHPELARGYLRMRHAGLPRTRESARRILGASWAPPQWKGKISNQGGVGAWYGDVFERRGWQDEGPPIFTPGLQIALDMWRTWRHTGDEEFLREIAWPFMREVCRFYLVVLEKGEDGLYHLPASHPYEHASGYFVRDCLTDMAHLHTAFPAAATVAERCGDQTFAKLLRDVAANLPDVELIPIPSHYLKGSDAGPVFAEGYYAGERPPFDRMLCVGRRVDDGKPVYFRANVEGIGGDSLFPGSDESVVWPSGALGLKDRGTNPFRAAQTSVLANNSFPIMGWSIATIVMARLGLAERLPEALSRHVEQFQHFPQGMWNYQESQSGSAYDHAFTLDVNDRFNESDQFPFLRQPHTHFGLEPGAVLQTTINEMLLQSYDGTIRLCPAIPKEWNGVFSLWAEGGFRVTARVVGGKATEAVVHSTRGQDCRVAPHPDGASPSAWTITETASDAPVKATLDGDALVFPTQVGKSYRIAPRGAPAAQAVVFTGERNEHAKRRGSRWIGIPRRW